jgi:hypothetical protein
MKPLPYRFPDERSVILRDAQRVQALPPEERLRALLSFLAEGEQLAANSPNQEAAFQLRVQERAERRRALRAFLRKHGF